MPASGIQPLLEADGDDARLPRQAVALAEAIFAAARAGRRRDERAQARLLDRLVGDPDGEAFTIALTDRAFRTRRARRLAEQLRHLLRRFGLPRYLGRTRGAALAAAGIVSRALPGLTAGGLVAQLRHDTRRVIVPAERRPFAAYLRARAAAGVRLNVNRLGEAILGEEEADRRRDDYRRLLERDEVAYASIKISSITSLLAPAAHERTVAHIVHRLEPLLAASIRGGTAKSINFDMEEFRDLELTIDALRAALDREEFARCRCGVALQAYLPDSFAALEELTGWARARVERGGAPIKVRLVKGANLALERVEASLHGWAQAPYPSKHEVDANFKRMLRFACRPENARAVNLGVASHNVFDLAYALLLRRRHGVEAQVEIEMLEGMADHLARIVGELADGILLYCPAVRTEDFRSAIAYLMRRLDENTEVGNFLPASFAMAVGDDEWDRQRDAFLAACDDAERIPTASRRDQDRAREEADPAMPGQTFANDPETDWSRPANRRWLADHLARDRDGGAALIPLVVAGEEVPGPAEAVGRDPAAPEAVADRHGLAGDGDVDRALDAARGALGRWGAVPAAERGQILAAAARELRRRRGRLMAACIRDGGKSAAEADGEICEAIDFAAWYARSFDAEVDGAVPAPRGVVTVAPPWNFPVSIPCGGTCAALAAGNAVILKPAPESVRTAWEMAGALWDAGVPRDVLQFLPCDDAGAASRLIVDPRVDSVILTGASATARRFLGWRPDLHLCAETGGKNAILVSAMADRDAAIADAVASAFAHAGQKCSACSLLICEAEVHDDPGFRRQLRDAAASLPCGPAADGWHRVTPLIREPGPELRRAIGSLDPGESWLLAPRIDADNPQLATPGIKLGVRPGSFFHRTECFGPVLGVMRARDLAEGLALQNAVPYGLTAGLHSLDEREQRWWGERIEAGNCYVNRGITAAIVNRQPFGGWKDSCFGPGAKAGGPNYAFQFARWRQERPPELRATPPRRIRALLHALRRWGDDDVRVAAESDAWWWREHFGRGHDPSRILGEVNLFRYRPLPELYLRAGDDAAPGDALRCLAAARLCGAAVHLSVPPALRGLARTARRFCASALAEDEDAFAARLHPRGDARLRVLGTASPRLLAAASAAELIAIVDPPIASGRIELCRYLREQAVSHRFHRYGNTALGSPFAP